MIEYHSITPANCSSGYGSSVNEPTVNTRSGWSRRAMATMLDDRSTPSTRHPRSARYRLIRPAPHPASRTCASSPDVTAQRRHRPWRGRVEPRHGVRQVGGVVLRHRVVGVSHSAEAERIRRRGGHEPHDRTPAGTVGGTEWRGRSSIAGCSRPAAVLATSSPATPQHAGQRRDTGGSGARRRWCPVGVPGGRPGGTAAGIGGERRTSVRADRHQRRCTARRRPRGNGSPGGRRAGRTAQDVLDQATKRHVMRPLAGARGAGTLHVGDAGVVVLPTARVVRDPAARPNPRAVHRLGGPASQRRGGARRPRRSRRRPSGPGGSWCSPSPARPYRARRPSSTGALSPPGFRSPT